LSEVAVTIVVAFFILTIQLAVRGKDVRIVLSAATGLMIAAVAVLLANSPHLEQISARRSSFLARTRGFRGLPLHRVLSHCCHDNEAFP